MKVKISDQCRFSAVLFLPSLVSTLSDYQLQSNPSQIMILIPENAILFGQHQALQSSDLNKGASDWLL